jgi:protein FAM50
MAFIESPSPQARGKSGPLFNFDAYEDIRLINDASVEKEESHAGMEVFYLHLLSNFAMHVGRLLS